jgi:hypothetical protein
MHGTINNKAPLLPVPEHQSNLSETEMMKNIRIHQLEDNSSKERQIHI